MTSAAAHGHGPGPPRPGEGTGDTGAGATAAEPASVELSTHKASDMQGGKTGQAIKEVLASSMNDSRAEGKVAPVDVSDVSREATPANTAGPALTWSERLQTRQPQTSIITEEMARKSHMLAGIWNPMHVKQLLHTLMHDWTTEQVCKDSPLELQMRAPALAPAPARALCDANIRAWTEMENTIMTAYVNGQLELPHPPNFIKEIMVGEHRAIIEEMHEAHSNAALTAIVPASVRISKYTAHATIFKELFQANTDKNTGQEMMRVFQRDVKRISFDGVQTLLVVFYSKYAMARWTKKALRLQRAVILLQDTLRRPDQANTGIFSAAQLELQYAIRVYGGDRLGLTALAKIFRDLAGATLLDVEYARATTTDIYDNRYATIRFAQSQCPEQLVGVTRLLAQEEELVIHHYQQHLRKPCARCLNQWHGLAKCTLATSKLEEVKNKATRHVSGNDFSVRPDTLSIFTATSVAHLVELIAANQNGDTTQLQMHQAPTQSGATGSRDQSADPGGSRGGGVNADADTRTSELDQDGFITKESKRAKHASREAENAGKKGRKQRSKGKACTIVTRTELRRQVILMHSARRRFRQTREVLGRFEALADTDSDISENEEMDFDIADGTETVLDGMLGGTNFVGEEGRQAPIATATGPAEVCFSDEEMKEDPPTQMQSEVVSREEAEPDPTDSIGTPVQMARGRKQHAKKDGKAYVKVKIKQPQKFSMKAGKGPKRTSRKGVPKSESLRNTQRSMDTYMQPRAGVQQDTEQNKDNAIGEEDSQLAEYGDMVEGTPTSQDEVIIGITRAGTEPGDADLPIQLGQWIYSFNGRVVDVMANGQCLFLALHATMMNVEGTFMKNTQSVVTNATDLKWYIYSLMMKNLRNDVAVNILDPVQECANLYPGRPKYKTVASATAALFVHYDHARARSVGKTVPAAFWAGPHELRAIAQYLREPILVFDVNSHKDAHLQRYGYAHHRLPDGSDHESGIVTVMTDREAADYVRACWGLHVLPTFLVLKHHERHFAGINHGELFIKWRAEGDPDFTESSVSEEYEWRAEVNDLSEYERTVDLSTINHLADMDNVNNLLIKRVSMRLRLDLVHARIGAAILDHAGLEVDWDEALAARATHS